MKTSYGLVLPSSAGTDVIEPDVLWEIARRADESLLSHLWVSDHLVWWHPMYESLSLLSALAARTTRIRLGTAVLLLAMREPVAVAKTLASIARLSSDRLTVGVGIGGEFPLEWQATGVETKTRARRTEEMVDAMRSFWNEGSSSFSGKHIEVPEIELQPKPTTQPPVWFGGRAEVSARRAGRMGDGWMGIFLTPERYAERMAHLSASAVENGRDPSSIARSLYLWTCVDEDREAAKRAAENLLPAFYNVPYEKLERYVAVGNPHDCVTRFKEFAEAGAEDIAIAMVPSAGPLETMSLLVENLP